MHIVIITKTLPPAICGIGDHSVLLGKAIRSTGHRVTLLAGFGSPGENICIVKNFWCRRFLDSIIYKLEDMKPDCLILQYTPLMFCIKGKYQNFAMADFWSACSRNWDTSLILHETYFKAWWHPTSLIKGALEKRLLKLLVRNSHNVFTSSQPLLEEIKHQGSKAKIALLPIGSNFPFNAIDRDRMRSAQGIDYADVLLVLFGGGAASLRRLNHYVNAVDFLLAKNGIKSRWLLLGGVKENYFSLTLPVISPGFLSQEDLSAWLQLTDIFLMPQISGLSAKRGTLMAALQHGLPVVGTKGPMSDFFWNEAHGVVLISMPGAEKFADTVLGLAKSADLRKKMGEKNLEYFEAHFTWEKIAGDLLKVVLR